LLLSARGQGPPLASTITEIALLLLAPLALGQLVRPLLRTKPPRWLITNIANLIILFIVFAAFANSARSGAFGDAGLAATLMVVVIAGGVFVMATGAAVVAGRRLGFDKGDRIALLFCGSQKTLAAGAPMAQILFAGNPALGLILLPLMAYHAIQLFGAASIVARLGTRTAARTADTGS
jgi:solute carrier family 10 (sodium/bile acid cotransporter), member 7